MATENTESTDPNRTAKTFSPSPLHLFGAGEQHNFRDGVEGSRIVPSVTYPEIFGGAVIYEEIAWSRNVSLQRVRHLHWFC